MKLSSRVPWAKKKAKGFEVLRGVTELAEKLCIHLSTNTSFDVTHGHLMRCKMTLPVAALMTETADHKSLLYFLTFSGKTLTNRPLFYHHRRTPSWTVIELKWTSQAENLSKKPLCFQRELANLRTDSCWCLERHGQVLLTPSHLNGLADFY